MSRKVKKKAAPAKVEVQKEKKIDKKKLKLIIISAVAALLLIAFVIGLVAVILSQRDFDYMKDNISRYVTIDEKDYKNFDVEIAKDEIDDADIEREINFLLYDNREKDPAYDGALVLNKPITVGDKVYIYYRGYTVKGDGSEVELSGGTNLAGEVATLEIGSGSFVQGFEESLIGKIPKDYVKFKKITTGYVSEGQVAYVSAKVILPNGKTNQLSSARIDLSLDNDKEWGDGFVEYLTGVTGPNDKENSKKEIGKTLDTATFAVEGGSAVYYDLVVDFVTECEAEPLTIEAKFPIDYSAPDLRGASVKFDVYIDGAVIYDTPEYNEEFITETLKIKEEDLSEYEGEGIIEKHRAKMRAELEEELVEKRKSVIEEAMWNQFNTKAKFKKLPEYEVRGYYAQYYEEVMATYQSYSSSYSSVDEFARAYFGLDSSANWREHITNMAKNVVAEKLVFYYIVREENITPDKESYDKLYEEYVGEHLDYYLEEVYAEELEKIEDNAEREERIAEITEEMFDYYGEKYFEENVYYNYALEELLKFANVIDITDK